MKLLTKQNLANLAAERWLKTYCPSGAWLYGERKQLIHQKLLSLDGEPKAEDVDSVIGNKSWTDLTCHCCNKSVDAVVSFKYCVDNVAYVCNHCSSEMVKIFRGVK